MLTAQKNTQHCHGIAIILFLCWYCHLVPQERASNKILEPVFKRRREAVKDIPKFWPVALMNSTLATFIQADDDIKALSALEDVWVQRDPTESRVFTIEFVSVQQRKKISFFV